MKLSDITFPVYVLKDFPPVTEEKVDYYLDVTGEKLYIVDDKNLSFETLSSRRLRIPKELLYPLRTAIFYIGDLVKAKSSWLIDSKGKVFRYKKSKMTPLTCRKIKNIIRITGAVLVEVEGISSRFAALYPPTVDQKYAGILEYGGGYILYGFFKEPFKPTRRKV